MSATTYELIGRIINPAIRRSAPTTSPASAAIPEQSLSVLIGRILGPPAPPTQQPDIARAA